MIRNMIMCLAAALVLTACNGTTDKSDNAAADADGMAAQQSEMPVAGPDDEGQGSWTKQTTIMTSKPMVIDFFATWCGPCKELEPILAEVEKNHKGDVIFKRIDVDQEADLAQEFNIQAVPTLMFVTPKGEYQTLLGLQEANVIEAKIAELLTRSAN